MGRQSAGASFLAGYAQHGAARDLTCMAPDRKAAEAFSETVRGESLSTHRKNSRRSAVSTTRARQFPVLRGCAGDTINAGGACAASPTRPPVTR